MGRKAKGSAAPPAAAAAAAQAEAAEEAEPQAAAGAADGDKERTFKAPSGKHYVITQDCYPSAFPPEIRDEVVTAGDGDLLELFMTHADVGYGRRFKPREGAVNEGVFRLEWVRGVRLVLEDGKRRPVEVDITSPEFGFQQPKGGDTASKLRLKRYRKKMEDAAKVWGKTGEDSALAKQEAAAAEAAASLERADVAEKARKLKAQRQKQQRELQRLQQQQQQQQQLQEEQQRRREQEQEQEREQEQELDLARQGEADEDRGGQRHQEGEAPQSERPREQETVPNAVGSAGGESARCRSPSSPREGTSSHSGSSPEAPGSHAAGWAERRRPGDRRRVPVAQGTWDSHWEKQAAQLEAVLSASSSGMEDTEGDDGRKPPAERRSTTRKFTRSLLVAKRSGELQAIAEEWEKAHCEMASKASALSALKEKVRRGLQGAQDKGDFERIIEEVATEAQQKAAEVRELKERVFRAMIAMKRSRNLERTTSDMDEAQKALEMRAFQLKKLMKRAWKGMVESKRHGELERITDEMSEQFQTKAESLRHKVRKGLLRAYRAGELQEIIQEFGEMADSVPDQGVREPAFDGGAEPPRTPPPPVRRRWAEFSSDSDTLVAAEPPPAAAGQRQPGRRCASEADVSGSDADSSASPGPGSPDRQ